MTLAEIYRALESKARVMEREQKLRAYSDYTLADLIGRSVARIHSSSNKFPTLAEAYPALFDTQEEQERNQQQKDELSAIRFRQFAQFHNKNFTTEVANISE